MFRARQIILCAVLMSGTLPHLEAQAPAATTADVETRSDIVYMQGAKGPLKADVYLPAGKGPFPGILFIHGGAWINGNRYQMLKLIRDLTLRGYVGFTIEYDVDPVTYPASFQESLTALKFFRQHADEFHLDASRVAVAGSSAGGELAALVALNPSGVTLPPAASAAAQPPVQAAVILNGVLDLVALGDSSAMVTQYLGSACTVSAAACRDASPLAHVHPGVPCSLLVMGLRMRLFRLRKRRLSCLHCVRRRYR